MSVPASTFIIRIRTTLGGSSWLTEQRVGSDMREIVSDLQELRAPFVLEAVHRLDFTAGAITDATSDALHALAADCEHQEIEAPAGCLAAFKEHGVPLPVLPPDEPYVDPNDEHRLLARELVSVGRAA